METGDVSLWDTEDIGEKVEKVDELSMFDEFSQLELTRLNQLRHKCCFLWVDVSFQASWQNAWLGDGGTAKKHEGIWLGL